VQSARPVEGRVARVAPTSFDDHFTQAAMFYRSLTPIEQAHIVEAFTFELGKCYEQAVKERQLEVLADVDAELCEQVAQGLGLPAPKGKPPAEVTLSPALSQVVTTPGPVKGRKVAIIADDDSDLAGVAKLVKALDKAGVIPAIVAPAGGILKSGRRTLTVDRTFDTARSIEFDAVVVAGGALERLDIKMVVLLHEMLRHCKPLGAWGDARNALQRVDIDLQDPGVVTDDDASSSFGAELLAALGLHRVWDRADAVMSSAVAPVRPAAPTTKRTRRR